MPGKKNVIHFNPLSDCVTDRQMAANVGFEPTGCFQPSVFKTDTLNHSVNSPYFGTIAVPAPLFYSVRILGGGWYQGWESNPHRSSAAESMVLRTSLPVMVPWYNWSRFPLSAVPERRTVNKHLSASELMVGIEPVICCLQNNCFAN